MRKKVFIFSVLSLASLGWVTTNIRGLENRSFALSAEAVASEVKFECESNRSFIASFSTKEAVVNLPDEQELILPHIPSASGAKYSNGNVTVWTKGRQAFVEVDGEIILDKCFAANATDSNLNYFNRTTITSIGNGLRLYEGHLGKTIEVTDHIYQYREPDYIVYGN